MSLSMSGIDKAFGANKVLKGVDFSLKDGEIRALIGENGAGKTTLMNILYGIHEPTNGEVYIRGRKVERFSPKTAISMGVGMVHQHFMLVPSFTVAQNIVMSREPRRLGVLFDNKAAEAAAQSVIPYHTGAAAYYTAQGITPAGSETGASPEQEAAA